jgi:hypothetical protein
MVDEGMARNVVRMDSVKGSGLGGIIIFGRTVCICSGATAVGHPTRRANRIESQCFGAYECVHHSFCSVTCRRPNTWFFSKVKEKEKWYFKNLLSREEGIVLRSRLRLAAARWANQNSGNSSKSS